MKGRYKMLERSTMLRKYVRASIRVDVWNGAGLTAGERLAVKRELVDWVLREFEFNRRVRTKGAAA